MNPTTTQGTSLTPPLAGVCFQSSQWGVSVLAAGDGSVANTCLHCEHGQWVGAKDINPPTSGGTQPRPIGSDHHGNRSMESPCAHENTDSAHRVQAATERSHQEVLMHMSHNEHSPPVHSNGNENISGVSNTNKGGYYKCTQGSKLEKTYHPRDTELTATTSNDDNVNDSEEPFDSHLTFNFINDNMSPAEIKDFEQFLLTNHSNFSLTRKHMAYNKYYPHVVDVGESTPANM